MESIDFQRQTLLLKDLTMLFEDVRDELNVAQALQKSNLEKMIKDYTGLKVKTVIQNVPYPNAYVMIPNIDRNNPVLADFFRAHFDGKDGLKLIKKNGGVLKGWVDREKSKIGGTFSDVEIKMGITSGLLTSDFFSSEEVASVVLHELGHLFTYLEYLGSSITDNYVMQTITRELMGTREVRRKYEVIKEGSDVLGIDIDDPEALIRSNNETVIQTVIIRKQMEKRYSQLGSTTHDITAWEMLSDQFATRHGGGRALVTALDRMHRMSGAVETGHLSTRHYLAAELLKLLHFLVLGPFLLIALPLTLIILNTNEKLYDEPKERMERIRRDMINELKKEKLDKDYRDQLLQDIEVIEVITKEMNDKRSFLQFFHSTVYPKARHQYNQMRFQQDLEILTNNDVFVRSQKLKTLKI
jgi:hypothetical protein